MPTEKTIRSFWNRAAEENPHWYVSSYGSYDADRNLDEFWASGGTIWSDISRDGRASLRRSASWFYSPMQYFRLSTGTSE